MTAVIVNNEKCLEDIIRRSPVYFIKLEMSDGSSELLSVTEKQIADLGIKIATPTINNDTNKTKNDQEETDSDYLEETPNGLVEDNTAIKYQIVHPEDLNLQRPVTSSHLPKGRPKKRQTKDAMGDIESATKSVKCTKGIRTRSGRITKPPKYFEKDFKKIDLFDTNVEDEIVTNEIETLNAAKEPAKVNEKQNSQLLQLQVHRKKRIISGQYRCSTCSKAYLGQLRLLKHFQQYPDHRDRNLNQKQHSSTWKYLIETAMKSSSGSKAKTFCDELSLLIQNARILAKYLFKLSQDENAFHVDDMLANALGINSGKYTLNENDLCKDVTLFTYLDMNYFDETYLNGHDSKSANVAIDEQSKESKVNTQNAEDAMEKDVTNRIVLNDNKKEKVATKKMHYDLQHPLLSDVDGLIIPEDSSQNILDTSSSSDDIMNVDQFVNERFKKLTEPEIEIPNTSLNLDLPSMELFQFHGT